MKSNQKKDESLLPVKTVLKGVVIISIILAVIWGIGTVFGIFGEAATVAQEEFGAKAAVTKYEWFKDAHATISEKQATIATMEQDAARMKAEYGDTPRRDWDRTDKDQINQWRREVSGLKASYNGLVAEYNANSSKFTWSGFEGDTPETLKEYTTE